MQIDPTLVGSKTTVAAVDDQVDAVSRSLGLSRTGPSSGRLRPAVRRVLLQQRYLGLIEQHILIVGITYMMVLRLACIRRLGTCLVALRMKVYGPEGSQVLDPGDAHGCPTGTADNSTGCVSQR